jgi:hypothetical protein
MLGNNKELKKDTQQSGSVFGHLPYRIVVVVVVVVGFIYTDSSPKLVYPIRPKTNPFSA